jgi:hypothetical protein
VALTRARDRLYLAGTISNGKLTLQRGSIGRVLPVTLTAAMAVEPAQDVMLTWVGASATHQIRRIGAPDGAPPRSWRARTDTRNRLNDHAPITFDAEKASR